MVLALLLAATGKSAQIPLFNWLPDAMEGPTPVSALIHAATMVTAGVYLLVRMSPVLALSSSGRMTIAVIGGVTAFVAATIATSQKDIKKVLAFSTVSQIGYMVLAVGVGAYGAAIFLMVSHAFFKALLFLGSGSVIHSLNGEQDMRKMGGLAKFLPLTFPTFLIGWLAISGIPPFAGFWSKGDVLTNVFEHNKALWVLGVVTAILTAYYMSRLFVLTFRGTERFREVTHGHDPHESPWMMTTPLVILAALSVLGGALAPAVGPSRPLEHFLTPTFGYVAPIANRAPQPVRTRRGGCRGGVDRTCGGLLDLAHRYEADEARRRASSNTSGTGTTSMTRRSDVRSSTWPVSVTTWSKTRSSTGPSWASPRVSCDSSPKACARSSRASCVTTRSRWPSGSR